MISSLEPVLQTHVLSYLADRADLAACRQVSGALEASIDEVASGVLQRCSLEQGENRGAFQRLSNLQELIQKWLQEEKFHGYYTVKNSAEIHARRRMMMRLQTTDNWSLFDFQELLSVRMSHPSIAAFAKNCVQKAPFPYEAHPACRDFRRFIVVTTCDAGMKARTLEVWPLLEAARAGMDALQNHWTPEMDSKISTYFLPYFGGLVHVAAAANRVDVLKFLNSKEALLDEELEHNRGFQPIHCAVDSNAVQAAEYLVGQDVSIDDETEGGITATMLAAYRGHLKILNLLLDNDADADYLSHDKLSALRCLLIAARETPSRIAEFVEPFKRLLQLTSLTTKIRVLWHFNSMQAPAVLKPLLVRSLFSCSGKPKNTSGLQKAVVKPAALVLQRSSGSVASR